MKTSFLDKFLILLFFILSINISIAQVPDPDLGLRAEWMKGSWGLNWKPVYYTNDNVEKNMSIEPFLDQISHLETIDYIQIHLNESYIYSACHTAPHDILESLWEGDMSSGSPINLVVPRASSGQDQFLDWLLAIKAKGLKTMVYVNSGQLMWDTQPDVISDVQDRWKTWCDTNAAATAFVNSQSYHTNVSYPDRKYYFCYAEFILKEYAERYGTLIDAWIFDTASMLNSVGDDHTVQNIDSQRIHQAFADACHVGNPNAAVSFNHGVGERNTDRDPNLNPFEPVSMFDDYTFGHPFGGAGDMTFPEILYDYNYGIISWMSDYEGSAFSEDNMSWNDNVVSHFDPKMSTTAWNRGATPCLTNEEFVEWNATGLINGGAISWGAPLIIPFMNRDESVINLTMHDYAVEQLTLMDEYLQEHQDQTITPIPPIISGGNIAPTGTATQSSTSHGAVASLAIDGNTDGAWSSGSVTHTQNEINPWWALDLGAEYPISEIRIYNRTDACCVDRLSDFIVFVWDADGNRTHRSFITTTPDPYASINLEGIVAKSIRIESNLTNSLQLAEVQVFAVEPSEQVVHITKANMPSFALDGNNGGENGQSVYLWNTNENNVNQQWIEISRGDGYYSYQKQGTNFCIDGMAPGASNGQNVYLWTCGENNQNQHWLKIQQPDGSYRLEKRNDASFAINGGNGGANGQDVNLWNSTSSNLNWFITPLNVSASAKAIATVIANNNDVVIYPNPVTTVSTIQGAANSIIKIYDIKGVQLLTKEILSDSENLDLSSLAKGIYYAQVKSETNISVVKILKE